MELVDMRDLGSRAAMRVGSSPFRRTSSSQATYRLRRAFSFHCKAHRALILLLLASNRDPLRWARGWVPPLRGGFVCRGKNIDFNRPFHIKTSSMDIA